MSAERPHAWRGALAAGAVALVLYVATAAPGVLWGDSAKLTLYALDLELHPNPGGHPGYVMLAWALLKLLPGSPARVLNLFSALCAAVGVGATYRLAERLDGPVAGAAAAVTLAVAHLYWGAATLAETYAPASACVALAALAALRYAEAPGARRGALVGLLLGVGASFNAIAAVVAPGVLLLALSRRGTPSWRGAGGFVLGLLPGLAVYLVAGVRSGEPMGLLGGAGFEASHYLALGAGMLRELVRYPAYLVYQVPDPLLLAVVPGAAWLARRRRGVGLGLGLFWLLDVLLAAAWLRQREFLMLSVAMIPVAVVIGVGLSTWARTRVTRRGIVVLLVLGALTPPLVYEVTPVLSERLGIDLVGARPLPYRDAALYYLRPWKRGQNGAERYAKEALAAASPDGIIEADFTVARVLEYVQRRGVAPGVSVEETDRFIFSGGGDAFARRIRRRIDRTHRPVFLGDDEPDYYFIARLKRSFVIRRDGVIYRVLPRAAADSSAAAPTGSRARAGPP